MHWLNPWQWNSLHAVLALCPGLRSTSSHVNVFNVYVVDVSQWRVLDVLLPINSSGINLFLLLPIDTSLSVIPVIFL